MIDQSNRAGKLNRNGSEDLDGKKNLCLHTITKRRNPAKRVRGTPQNQRKLHHQTSSTKIPSPASVISRRPPLSSITKGKSI
jgi:hypothetical protein